MVPSCENLNIFEAGLETYQQERFKNWAAYYYKINMKKKASNG